MQQDTYVQKEFTWNRTIDLIQFAIEHGTGEHCGIADAEHLLLDWLRRG